MKIKSYAKINLTLDILGKREDGYHEIETIFQQIDLYDEISIEESTALQLSCNLKELESDKNLVIQAVKVVQEKFGITKAVKIELNKTIPVGAGLSGGSSNAAATLKALNQLWSLNLSTEELIDLSEVIGMDVAFHIVGGTCKGTGRGEILEKLPPLPQHYVVLLCPDFSVSTQEAYANLNLEQCGKKRATKKFIENYDLQYLHNDFEESVFRQHSQLAELKNLLGPNAVMSGSGSSLFGLFLNRDQAETIYQQLNRTGQSFITFSLGEHK